MFSFSHGFTFFTIDFWDLSVNACKSVVVFVYYQLFSWFAFSIKRYYTSVFRLSCVSPLFLFSGSYVLWFLCSLEDLEMVLVLFHLCTMVHAERSLLSMEL